MAQGLPISGLCDYIAFYIVGWSEGGGSQTARGLRSVQTLDCTEPQGRLPWMDSLEPVGRMSVPHKLVPPTPPLLGAAGHASLEQLRLMLGKRIYRYNTVNPSDVFGIKLKEVSQTRSRGLADRLVG